MTNTSNHTRLVSSGKFIIGLALAGCLLTSHATGNDAVSALNGKIDAAYGEINDTYSRSLSGSLSLPVGDSYGIQVDTLYQRVAERDFYGLGGHFFTRKSDTGLLGLIVGGIHSNAISNVVVGLEGEYYLDRLTFGALAGYDTVMKNSTQRITFSPKLNTQREFVMANVYAAIYPMDDLMLRFDYTSRINRNFYDLSVEYQTPIKGLAVFGDIGFGDNDFFQLLGGMRYYFGGKKTLKARHREDDPENFLNGSTGGGSLAAGTQGASTPPPPLDKK
jgi:hypothetical protein